jgi:hypothetical protein
MVVRLGEEREAFFSKLLGSGQITLGACEKPEEDQRQLQRQLRCRRPHLGYPALHQRAPSGERAALGVKVALGRQQESRQPHVGAASGRFQRGERLGESCLAVGGVAGELIEQPQTLGRAGDGIPLAVGHSVAPGRTQVVGVACEGHNGLWLI